MAIIYYFTPFEDSKIRREIVNSEWVFSVVDVIAAITESPDPTNYWSTLKKRELEHGIQLSAFCGQLKLKASGYYIAKGRTPEWVETRTASKVLRNLQRCKVVYHCLIYGTY